MRISFLSLLMACLLVACDLDSQTPVTPPPAAAPATTVLATTTTSTTPPTTVPEDACPTGDVMLADGGLLSFDGTTSDAARVAGVGWRTTSGCQTVVVSFATGDGAPATTPPSLDVRLLRQAGILRIDTSTVDSVIADQLVEDGWVERLYVPVDDEGERFIDLVLSEPAVARARALTSPARLEIELQPGGPDELGRPLITQELVLVEPGSSATAQSLFDIAGYSTGSLEELGLVIERDEEPILEDSLPLEPVPGLWTGFTTTISVGDENYDRLRVTSPEESVLAAIPFSR